MTPDRFLAVTSRYPGLRIAVVGDFCLDRYLEIDPARGETSIETGLPVHNVVRVRAQPGGAGTILNNLVALGVGTIFPVSFCGDDGEGYELRRGLSGLPGVVLDHFITTPERRTFTYCKPLLLEEGKPPVELNRLDSKNWSLTPRSIEACLVRSLDEVASGVDAVIVLDQVENAGTGALTAGVLDALGQLARTRPSIPILADSRRGLAGWPSLDFKMNAAELASLLGKDGVMSLDEVASNACALSARNGRPVYVTLSERGITGALPDGTLAHVPALPVRGPIDVVGAGDSVTANLASALSAGATLHEALELAAIASSLVIHQLGTTGTAGVAEIGNWVD